MSHRTLFIVRRTLLAFCLSALPLGAQDGGASPLGTAAAPTPGPLPRSQRPALVIKDFDFSAQLSRDEQVELNSLGAAVWVLRGGNPQGIVESNTNSMTKATAQLLTSRLSSTSQFRIYEREQVQSVTAEQDLIASDRAQAGQTVARTGELRGARYVVTGAITKFGKSKKKKGAGVLGLVPGVGALGGLQTSKTDYEVGLTVKVIESTTGEVVAAATTEGVVSGDAERNLAALAGSWGGLAGVRLNDGASGEREKRVSEALQAAVDKIVIQLIAARERGDLEP